MHGAYEFLTALTIVLGVAGLTTVVFQRLHQPVILGYILAGLIIGPHVPIPLIASPDVVHTLSELGVILLMFGLGLEFSLGKLYRIAPNAGVTALVQCSVMVVVGYLTGRALGWTSIESVFAGAVIAISSTTIIAKAFDEQAIHGRLRELVVAILVVEDLIAVVLIAVLTGVATGAGMSTSDLALTLGKLAGFIAVLVIGGLVIVPRLMRLVVRLGRPETTVISAIAVCFGASLLAHEAGYSVALGAFIGGMLVAESGEARQIEPLVHPVRDVFAAVFFVSVGMLLDPSVLVEQWLAITVLTVVVVIGKIASVSIGAFVVGNGTRTSVAAGMSLAQIGEFSFIIAGLGMSFGVVGKFLYPVAVAVSAITTLSTPWLIKGSSAASGWVDRKLPKPLQTFVAFYEGWIERLRGARREQQSKKRRLVRTLLLDMCAVAAVVIAVALSFDRITEWGHDHISVAPSAIRIIVVVVAALFALPFCFGILRTTRRLASTLAVEIVPERESTLDLGMVPRRVLAAALQLAGVLIAGLPLVAITQPFLPGVTAVVVLAVALALLLVVFWRTATDLHGHVRAASQVIVEALATQASADTAPSHGTDLEMVIPGIGRWVRVELPASSPAVGKTLGELELRGSTGATVLAIMRGEEGMAVPDAHEPLRAGDVLAITGSQDALAAATALLRHDVRK